MYAWSKCLLLVMVVSCISSLVVCSDSGSDAIPYPGPLPGQNPVLFAPDLINSGMQTRDFTMSPDGREFYFTVIMGRYRLSYIVGCRFENGRWTEPEVVPGLDKPGVHYLEPHISPDGQKFFFASNLNASDKEFSEEDEDIWVMDRIGTRWGRLRNLGAPVNTKGAEFYPTTTRDGTLYFTGPEKTGPGECIYRSRFVGGSYTEPQRLPEQVNAGKARYNAFISADDRMAIIPVYGHESNPKGVDYTVTFHNEDDSWTEPVSLGSLINTDQNDEHSASLSPDGKFLFFMSPRMPVALPGTMSYTYLKSIHTRAPNGNSAIYWVDASFLKRLRPKGNQN